jgi:ribonucleotide reductase alpha subunit
MGSLNVGIKESKMSQSINYRELKEQWKKDGEIPDWYSTNALQFFMDSYSYKSESVRSRDKTTCKYLADNSPPVYPSWWEEDGYTKGLNYEQVYFNAVYRDGYGVLSTPLKANGGLPDRGMPISCSGQTLFNSVASKSFVIGEMEQLVKNAHGCAITIDGWLAEGTIYDDDGNMSEGVIPIIQEIQKKTEEINQG